MAMSSDSDVSPEVMRTYYRRLYPFDALFRWLNHAHNPTKSFTHREFAFTLQGDVYMRYQSFQTAEDLKKQACSLNPTRFEIGPVYSAKPKDRKTAQATGKFAPERRELVFDIDMTDYDSIRTCCSGAAICARCWKFIAAAVRVLDEAIRDQFGYEHLLWVYSGRRGIHLWVSDKEAIELTDDQRKAVVNWLTVITGSSQQHKKVNVRLGSKPLPPSLQQALPTLAETFSELILEDQDCFGSTQGWEALLMLVPDKSVVEKLQEQWTRNPDRSSGDKWSDFKKAINGTKGTPRYNTLKAAMEDIIIEYTYPRLDAEVSKHRNHLLKAPFCIHPKTGRVCVPVDPEKIDEFEPEKVPTVVQLLRELDEGMATDADGETGHDWNRTSLKRYVEMMDDHAKALMNEVRKAKREAGDITW
ncbi:prim-pol domain-containing protein [Punctularia strigosozonata HHB-11173 SS5]|uniref:prim-pol domain-containing protein n=1 Tax=Punctularia strigosozonata (strain HHB-11173) TaxID=741275 RepID=UPI000441721A|nr:prim-pol domain-containing protein [Punctularia strigosozonata HHB-11173 SS5]EIN08316.1 prim-pol domain-containing protein [Punctularia strigosozonata HHB-11173 SS5]